MQFNLTKYYNILQKLLYYILPYVNQAIEYFQYEIVRWGLTILLSSLGIYYFIHSRSPQAKINAKRKRLHSLYSELYKIVDEKNCDPAFLRLAWSDAATYDRTIRKWPAAGGAVGIIRFPEIISADVNSGLESALELLVPVKLRYPDISWADVIQMAGVVAVEHSGGPKIKGMIYGRVDAEQKDISDINPRKLMPSCCVQPPPYYDGTWSAESHIRNVFYNRMGFKPIEIVALMGGHTLGRAFKEHSGSYSGCTNYSGEQGATEYTRQSRIVRHDGKVGVGVPGGCSWTVNWLTFDNSYFTLNVKIANSSRAASSNSLDEHITGGSTPSLNGKSLFWLPTDNALLLSPEYFGFFNKFAADQNYFFTEYSKVHLKFSNLGAKFEPSEGIEFEPSKL